MPTNNCPCESARKSGASRSWCRSPSATTTWSTPRPTLPTRWASRAGRWGGCCARRASPASCAWTSFRAGRGASSCEARWRRATAAARRWCCAALVQRGGGGAAGYMASWQERLQLGGVSWGRTMSAMARWLPVGWNEGVHVVLLNGAANLRDNDGPSHNVAERFAQAAKGTATLLPVPAIVGSSKTRQVLEEDPVIGAVMRLGRETTVACVGIGSLSERSVLVQSGYMDADSLQALLKAGAVGDILGRFIDEEGHIVSPDFDARAIGLSPALLRDKAHAIGVSGGKAKHRAVKACLLARYINVLVTDEATANYLLERP